MGGGNYSVKSPKIDGLQYASSYDEWSQLNFAHNREMRDRVREWEKKTHRNHTDLFWDMQEEHLKELGENAHEMKLDDAIQLINDSIPENEGRGWFVNADSLYKPRIFSRLMSTPNLLNAGWNVMYDHYKWQMREEGKTPLSFKRWLKTPMTFYRGHTGQSSLKEDYWKSYSYRRSIAEKFAGRSENAQVDEMKIRPIDTLGAYQTTGESEVFIPNWKLKR